MFRIGEFAQLLGVSIRTLRYYEEVGLLRAQRGTDNGYRGYSAEHLQRMRRILSLRDMGFSLQRIRQVMNGVPAGEFTNLLTAQYKDLRSEHARIGE
jgi:DNA-binding transcriptional MerR regulator